MSRKFLLSKKPKTKIIVVGSLLTTLSSTALVIGCSESDKEETSKLQTKSKRKIKVNALTKSLFRVAYSTVSNPEGEKYKSLLETVANSSATQKLKIEVSVNNGPFKTAVDKRRPASTFHKELLDSDQVRVRFLVADEYKNTHTLPADFNNIISFTVSDFKKEVDTTYLQKDFYEMNVNRLVNRLEGSPSVSITQKSGVASQFEVILLYAVQKQSGSAVSAYTKALPTNIERGDTIHVKFAIRDGAYAKFPASFKNLPFQFVVPRLKKQIKVNALTKSLFRVAYSTASNPEGEKYKSLSDVLAHSSATQKLKIEVSVNNGPFKTAVDKRRPASTFHKELLDSDQVRVRFSVADEHKNTHTLPADFNNIISFTVSDFKKEVDTTYLQKDSYEMSVEREGSPSVAITQKSGVASQFEAIPVYAVQKQSGSVVSEYTKALPANIERGDTIHVKFAIRDGVYAKFPASFKNLPFQFVVPRLKKQIQVNALTKSLFKVTYSTVSNPEGEKYKSLLDVLAHSSATQKLKIEVSVNNGPFKTAVDKRRPASTFHKELLDSDQVRVRFLVADEYKNTHTLPADFNNIISFTVSDFKKEVDTTYLQKDSYKMSVEGECSPSVAITQKSGVASQFEVILLYAVQKQPGSAVSGYTKALPANIERGDTIHVKFAIRDGAYAKFPASFTNAPFQFPVPLK